MSQQDMYIHTLVILLRGYRSIMQFLCIKSHWFQLLNEFLWLNETWCTCWSDAFWLLFEYFMNKWRHINSLIMVFWSHYLKWCILIHLYVCMWPLIVHSCCFNLPISLHFEKDTVLMVLSSKLQVYFVFYWYAYLRDKIEDKFLYKVI